MDMSGITYQQKNEQLINVEDDLLPSPPTENKPVFDSKSPVQAKEYYPSLVKEI
jgi:hypothetical protein